MIYKKHKNGSFNIHTIQTDRFKNVRMEIIFRNNIERDTIAKRTTLFNVLLETSEKYKTKRDITLKLEDLYNAVCYATSTKVGSQVVTSLSMDFINPKYTEENFLHEAIEFPFELLFHPNIVEGEFDEKTLEIIKTRLISDLRCLNEEPQKLSIQKALKAMDEKSITSLNLMGSAEEIESITPRTLKEIYDFVIKHDYVDVFIIGDIDMNEAIDIINKYAKFTTIKTHELNLVIENKIRKKPQVIKEPSNFVQTQLVYILNTIDLTPEEKKYAFIIYNMILGGGSLETKLYHRLRDEHSLCYNVLSLYQKYDNILIIQTAIDTGNVKLASSLIKKSLKDMINHVTEEEVDTAVSSVISSIHMALDQPAKIISLYLFQYMADLESTEERIKKFKNITANDIMRVAKKVSINTIYALEGEK